MKTKFKLGDTVKVSPANDNENYNSFRDKVLTITSVSTCHQDNPGYDEGVGGGLYDLCYQEEEGNEESDIIECWCALYDYELEQA